jgi:hypothetical protein
MRLAARGKKEVDMKRTDDIADAKRGREYQGTGIMNRHGRFGSSNTPAAMAEERSRHKILNPTIHGVLDYALALAFLAAPGWLGFSDTAASLSYILGVIYLAASSLTKYPLGAIKMIPFPVHGVLEAIMAACWIVMPWVFGYAADTAARNFYVIAGFGLLLIALLTDYKATGPRSGYADERRHHMIDRRQRSMPVALDRRTGLPTGAARLMRALEKGGSMAEHVKTQKLKGSDIDTETAAQQQARRLQQGAGNFNEEQRTRTEERLRRSAQPRAKGRPGSKTSR